jgi:predicted TIM-barrel fold metal-dependent hydrolase
MPIVDAQVHVWVSPPKADSPDWPHRRLSQFTWANALQEMERAGVDRALLVPMGADAIPHAKEAVALHPQRFAALAAIPIERTKTGDVLDGLRPTDGFIGLRAAINTPRAVEALQDGALDPVFAAAEREGIAIASLLVPGATTIAAYIAEKFRGLRLAIAHLGCPRADAGIKDSAAFAHLPELLALARHPQVAVCATGVSGYTTEPFPYPGLADVLHRVFDAFGPNRMFWGSDMTRLSDPYRLSVLHFTEHLPWLRGEDRDRVMGNALCDWIGWPA